MIIRLIALVLSLTACSNEPAASFTLGCFRENESTLQVKIKNEKTTDLHVILKKLDQVKTLALVTQAQKVRSSYRNPIRST